MVEALALRVRLFPPWNTRFVPLRVDAPAVLPAMVMNWLCALFQSLGRTRAVACVVAVAPALLKTVTVPVKSAMTFDLTCEIAIIEP